MTHDELHSLVSGQLRSCIDAHGPITKDLIGSAAKRVVKQLLGLAEVVRDPSREIAHSSEIADDPAYHNGYWRRVETSAEAPGASSGWQPIEAPFDVVERLHAVLTVHGIASRSDYQKLVTDLIRWAADACRQSLHPPPAHGAEK